MITVGTKVAILPGADYADHFIGQVGIVCKNHSELITGYEEDNEK